MEKLRFRSDDGVVLVADGDGPEAAPLIVLLHGGGQTRHSWAGTMGRLVGAGYHVINLDSRGHGESGWSETGDYASRAHAGDLAAVLRHYGKPAALVGASMGGMTSLHALANGFADGVEALVLVDIVPKPAREGVRQIMDFMLRHQNGFAAIEEAADAVAAYNPHRPRPRDPEGLRKNLRLRADGRLYWHWDPRMFSQSTDERLDLHEKDLLDACARIRIPTLLVRGEKSNVVDDDGVAAFRARLPQLEVAEVSSAGHMVAGDRNDVFGDAIVAFLERHLPVA